MSNKETFSDEPLEGRLWSKFLEEAQAALRNRDWAKALTKIEQAEANWPKMWECAIAAQQAASNRDLMRAAALEGMGRIRNAAEIYWSLTKLSSFTVQAEVRLVELYLAAGQREPLLRILDEMDHRHRESRRHLLGERFNPTIDSRNHHAVYMRKAIAMRQAASSGHWSKLIEVLRKESGKPSGYSPQEWTWRYWEPIDAARLMTTQPDQTVTLIVADLDSLEGVEAAPPNWHDLALGLAGTARALNKLRERAAKLPREEVPSEGMWVHPEGAAFVAIVAQAGAGGKELLRELATEERTPASLHRALKAWEQGNLRTELEDFALPPLPKDLDLPLTPTAALDES